MVRALTPAPQLMSGAVPTHWRSASKPSAFSPRTITSPTPAWTSMMRGTSGGTMTISSPSTTPPTTRPPPVATGAGGEAEADTHHDQRRGQEQAPGDVPDVERFEQPADPDEHEDGA